jgi:hypothetical protein
MAFRTKRGNGKRLPPGPDRATLKIRIKGRDNAPLTIGELREGLLEAARHLAEYEVGYRVKSAGIYLTLVDEVGDPVRVNDANELTLYPYKTAAEEFGVE